jgi:hypothetical protein
MNEVELRNHNIDDFNQCRLKYKLKRDGWRSLDPSFDLKVGEAVHAGLAVWYTTKDNTEMHAAAFAVIPEDQQEAKEMTFAILEGYVETYAYDTMQIISPEIEIKHPLTKVSFRGPNLTIGGRLDGLVVYDGENWVLENKTTGKVPGNFWKKYEFDRQTQEYTWLARQLFPEHNIVGTMVNAMFKPNNRKPEPTFERRFFRYSPKTLEIWRQETINIGLDIRRAIETDNFYRSGRCFNGQQICEFIEYCASDFNNDVLRSTHCRTIETKEDNPQGASSPSEQTP